jgi:hypothetical protein
MTAGAESRFAITNPFVVEEETVKSAVALTKSPGCRFETAFFKLVASLTLTVRVGVKAGLDLV